MHAAALLVPHLAIDDEGKSTSESESLTSEREGEDEGGTPDILHGQSGNRIVTSVVDDRLNYQVQSHLRPGCCFNVVKHVKCAKCRKSAPLRRSIFFEV